MREESKTKPPKYVRITKCSEDYWYKHRIGKVYKVRGVDKEDGDYEVRDDYDNGRAWIGVEDCEPVTKEELMQVGSWVKVKKYKEGKYDNLDEDEIRLWKENQGNVFSVQRTGNGWVEVHDNCWVWDTRILKPILNKGDGLR